MWRQGGQAVVDQVPVCWSFLFRWTPLYKRIYLIMYVLNFNMHKAQLPEHNCYVSQGLSVVGDIQVKTTTRNRSLC